MSDTTTTKKLTYGRGAARRWGHLAMAVIPCRMASERLPGKPLLEVDGRALVHWTYDRAVESGVDRVVVAAEDQEIVDYCEINGLDCMRTRANHPTGTHRCTEILNRVQNMHTDPRLAYGTFFNWQVDEPLVPVEYIQEMRKLLEVKRRVTLIPEIFTLTAPLPKNPSRDVVKTVRFEQSMECPWFSRAPMAGAVAHCGIYGYTTSVLKGLAVLFPTHSSRAESLEQLSWIEHGYMMKSVVMDKMPLSVNSPEDWEKFKMIIEEGPLDEDN